MNKLDRVKIKRDGEVLWRGKRIGFIQHDFVGRLWHFKGAGNDAPVSFALPTLRRARSLIAGHMATMEAQR